MTGRHLHRSLTMALSLVMAAVGVTLAVEALVRSGTPWARLLLGALFLAAGLGRLYVEVRRGAGR
jgi:hypothetical protein